MSSSAREEELRTQTMFLVFPLFLSILHILEYLSRNDTNRSAQFFKCDTKQLLLL